MSRGSGAKRWCFTINNPTEDDEQLLGDFAEGERCEYLVYGDETGEQGTRHFQGYLVLKNRQNMGWLKNHFHSTCHLEISRGTPKEASDYCKKDGEYEEFGELPSGAVGNNKQFEELRDWAKSKDKCPSEKEVAENFPALWCRYRRSVMDLVRMFAPQPNLQSGDMRAWQQELKEMTDQEADDRKVIFVVDQDGGSGKSWFARYMVSKWPDRVQVLGPGKRDDLAHVVDVGKPVILFNVPRNGMQFLNYGFLEALKDRMVLSPKYESQMKFLEAVPHVVVLCNEMPDESAMTEDRYLFFPLRRYLDAE